MTVLGVRTERLRRGRGLVCCSGLLFLLLFLGEAELFAELDVANDENSKASRGKQDVHIGLLRSKKVERTRVRMEWHALAWAHSFVALPKASCVPKCGNANFCRNAICMSCL